jgi:ATP-dependent Zn protease
MVTQFGFSDQLGNIDYANEQQSFLGSYNGGTSNSRRDAEEDRRGSPPDRRRGLRDRQGPS